MEDVEKLLDDLSDGVQLFQKSLQCAICLEILKNPVCTRCSHTFCQECIMIVVNRNRIAHCPLCNKTINRRGITQDDKIKKLVEKVQLVIGGIGKDTGYDIASHTKLPSSTREAFLASPKVQKYRKQISSVPEKAPPLKTSVPAEKWSKEQWLKRYEKQYAGKHSNGDEDIEFLSISQVDPIIPSLMPPPNKAVLEIKSKVDQEKVPMREKVQEWLHNNDAFEDPEQSLISPLTATPESERLKSITVTADVHNSLNDGVSPKVSTNALQSSSEDSKRSSGKNRIFTSKGDIQDSVKEEEKINNAPRKENTEEDPFEFISSQNIERPPKKKKKIVKDKDPVKKTDTKCRKMYGPSFKKTNKKKGTIKYSDANNSLDKTNVTFSCPVDINDTFDNLVASTKRMEPVKTLEPIQDENEEEEDDDIMLFRTPLDGPIIYYKPDDGDTTESMSDIDFSSGSDEEWSEEKDTKGKKGKNIRRGSLPARKNDAANKKQKTRSKSSGPSTRKSSKITGPDIEELKYLSKEDKQKTKIIESVKRVPLSPSKKTNVNTLDRFIKRDSVQDTVASKDVNNKLVEKVVDLSTGRIHAGKENFVCKIPENFDEIMKSTLEKNATLNVTISSRSPGWSRISQSKKDFDKLKKPVRKALNVSGGEACIPKKHGNSINEHQNPNKAEDLVSPVPTIDEAESTISTCIPVMAFNSPEALNRAKMMSRIVHNLESQIEPDTAIGDAQKEMITESVTPRRAKNMALQKFASFDSCPFSEVNAGESPISSKRKSQINDILTTLEDSFTVNVPDGENDKMTDFKEADMDVLISKEGHVKNSIGDTHMKTVLVVPETVSTMSSEQAVEKMETDQDIPRKEGNKVYESQTNQRNDCPTEELHNNIGELNTLTVIENRFHENNEVVLENQGTKEILLSRGSEVGVKEQLATATSVLSDVIGNSENTPYHMKNVTIKEQGIDAHQQTAGLKVDSKEQPTAKTDSVTSSDFIINSENSPNRNAIIRKKGISAHQQIASSKIGTKEQLAAVTDSVTSSDFISNLENSQNRSMTAKKQCTNNQQQVTGSKIDTKEQLLTVTDSVKTDFVGNSENVSQLVRNAAVKKQVINPPQITCMLKNDVQNQTMATSAALDNPLHDSAKSRDIKEGSNKKSCSFYSQLIGKDSANIQKVNVEKGMQLNNKDFFGTNGHSNTQHIPFIKFGYFRPLKKKVEFIILGSLIPRKSDESLKVNDGINTPRKSSLYTSLEIGIQTSPSLLNPLSHVLHVTDAKIQTTPTANPQFVQFVTPKFSVEDTQENTETFVPDSCDNNMYIFPSAIPLPRNSHKFEKEKCLMSPICEMMDPLPVTKLMDIEARGNDNIDLNETVVLDNNCAYSKPIGDYNDHGIPYSQFSTATTIKRTSKSPEYSSNSGTQSGPSVSLLAESETVKNGGSAYSEVESLKNKEDEAVSARSDPVIEQDTSECGKRDIAESKGENNLEQDAHMDLVSNEDASDSSTQRSNRRSSRASRQLKFSPHAVPKLSDPSLDVQMEDETKLLRNSMKRSRTESLSESLISDQDSKATADSKKRETKKQCRMSLKTNAREVEEPKEVHQQVANNEGRESLTQESEVINLLTPPEDPNEANQEQKWLGEDVPDSEELMARVMANIDADMAETRHLRMKAEEEKVECMVIDEDARGESPTLFTPPIAFLGSEEQDAKMTCELVGSETDIGSVKTLIPKTVVSDSDFLCSQQRKELQVDIQKMEAQVKECREELQRAVENVNADNNKCKVPSGESDNETEDDDVVEATPLKNTSANRTWDLKSREENKKCTSFQQAGQESATVTQVPEHRTPMVQSSSAGFSNTSSPLTSSVQQKSKEVENSKQNCAVDSVLTPSVKQFVLRLPETTPSPSVITKQTVVTPCAVPQPVKTNSSAVKPSTTKNMLTAADISPLTRVSAEEKPLVQSSSTDKKTPTKLCFICSGLPPPLIARVKALARMMGAEFSNRFEPHATHLVVKASDDMTADKTFKYLSAVVKGIWIVSFAWVNACLQARKFLPEDEYEMLDSSGEDGPHRSRISSSSLFTNFTFCCIEPFTDLTKDQLEGMLHECGASTVSSPDKLSCKQDQHHCMILVQMDAEREKECKEWWERYGVLPIGHEWVFESIGRYRLMPIWPFLMCPVNEELIRSLGFPEDALLSDDETEVESEV